MATRNVVLTEHQERLISSLVKEGRYQNASEVLRDGLRLLERHELEQAAKLTALREAARVGWHDFAAGRYIEVRSDADDDELWAEIDRKVDAKQSTAKAKKK